MEFVANKIRSKKSGQSTVEYLLLLAVLAAGVWAFNAAVSPRLAALLNTKKTEIENRAMRGNPLPATPDQQVQYYYRDQGKKVVVK